MTVEQILLFGCIFFAFALVSRKIQGTIVTAPILFTAAGYIAGQTVMSLERETFGESALHTIAELTLVLVLAADASRISLKSLYRHRSVPIRLLGLSLPATIGLGALVGLAVFEEISWVEAAVIAAILAPTDAALGASVLADKTVPLSVRQSLNVESGLNDGVSLPAVLFFACFLNLTHQSGEVNWLLFATLQLTLGPLAGLLVGWIGGRLIGAAAANGWITETFQGVAAMALAVIAFAAAEMVGGNGFIAAFACGLVYGNLHVGYSHFLHEFTETESEVLSHLTFFLFGLVVLPGALANVTPEVVLYGFLSLTVVRMAPVALSMIGSGFHWPTLGFLGWFGPRGLASLLFALLILEDLSVESAERIETIVAITVLMSILLHGLTAAPLSRRYGAWASRCTTDKCPENRSVDFSHASDTKAQSAT